MRILIAHNHYQQPGGEDVVFASEAALLEEHGHIVERLVFDNADIAMGRSGLASAQLAMATIWSTRGYTAVQDAIERFKPDIAHFHNTFPLLSPAGYYAARRRRVPVVQTLHNYRLLCANGLFYRDGHTCQDCLGRPVPLPGVAHACYRQSRAASSAVVAMQVAHRAAGSWTKAVDRYIVLAASARELFIAGGLPAAKIVVKPNFVAPDPGCGEGRGGYVLFVGRLSPEKGIGVLLDAWRQLRRPVRLRIVGDGPLARDVAAATQHDARITWCRQITHLAVMEEMRRAALLISASEWYEAGVPRTVIEAYAAGTPVIAPRLGAMAEFVRDGEIGWHFAAGDAAALKAAVERAIDSPTTLTKMRADARAEFETRYTDEDNYRSLIDIYAQCRN